MSWMRAIRRGVSGAAKSVGSGVSNVARGATGAVLDAGRNVKNTGLAIGNLAQGDLSGAANRIGDAVNNTVGAVKNVGRTLTGAAELSPVGIAAGAINGVLNSNNGSAKYDYTPQAPKVQAAEMPQQDPIVVQQKYEPVKTPMQLEQDRIAAAQKQDDIISGQVKDYQQAPDTAVRRYDVKDFDKGAFNEAEDIFQRNTIEGLKTGKFGDVESAFARTGRDSSLRTARGQQSGEAMAAAAGLQPGTPEYQRAVDMAVSNAEGQNLADSNANRQMQRNYYNDAMNRAEKIGSDMYNRASGERDVATAADAVEYSRNDTRFNNDQQDIRGFITSLPPNVANKARVLLSQGKDPRTALGYFDATGAISAPYRGATPSEQSYASQWQEATIRTPRMAGESDADYNARVSNATRDRLRKQDAVAFGPVNTANTAQENKAKLESVAWEGVKTGKNVNIEDWNAIAGDPLKMRDVPATNINISGGKPDKPVKQGDVVSYNGKKYLVANPSAVQSGKSYGNTEHNYYVLAYDENGNEVKLGETGWKDDSKSWYDLF